MGERGYRSKHRDIDIWSNLFDFVLVRLFFAKCSLRYIHHYTEQI